MSDVETTDETTAPEAPPEPARVHGALVEERNGQTVVFPERSAYLDVMKALKDDGYEMCVDLCGVDHLQNPDRSLPDGIVRERFEVVVNLLSLSQKRRIRVRVQVPESDPTVPTLFRLWPGSEAMEREAWDMLGIAFVDHPDLSRILMPEDWEGHPLRKDFAQGRVPVQFKAPNQPSTGGAR
ncbi:MAG TPA: NADH-quinone oxidoreductase subunit C [Acidimicrobiales bacterium]|jgi:NADH-quinone oxidoreductase subunit C|nr:NADH-quinone oxidoreductase subunit C [Acidimicrobiales bacterium]